MPAAEFNFVQTRPAVETHPNHVAALLIQPQSCSVASTLPSPDAFLCTDFLSAKHTVCDRVEDGA